MNRRPTWIFSPTTKNVGPLLNSKTESRFFLTSFGPERVEQQTELPATPQVPAPAKPAAVKPLAPARYRVEFTASAELRDKLERLKALMRSSVPDGDLATILDQVVTEKLE